MAHTQLETHGFATTELPQFANEGHQLQRCSEAAVRCRGYTVLPHRYTPRLGNFFGHFRAWKHATVARFSPLTEFNFNHLDLRVQRIDHKFFFTEMPVICSATKVPRTQLPNQVTAVGAVMTRNRPLTGIVCETTEFGAQVQRHDGIGAQGTKTHGRDIKATDVISLRAIMSTHPHTKIMPLNLRGRHGVIDPLISGGPDIQLRAKRPAVRCPFCTGINQ